MTKQKIQTTVKSMLELLHTDEDHFQKELEQQLLRADKTAQQTFWRIIATTMKNYSRRALMTWQNKQSIQFCKTITETIKIYLPKR
jgi:hypothetical protein